MAYVNIIMSLRDNKESEESTMVMKDFMDDMEARAFAAFAESNPRLKHLAELDSAGTATEAEEAEFG